MLSRCVFSLSWQEASAGRNLITLFLTVNNPGDFFQGPHAPTSPLAPTRAATPNARAHRRVRDAFATTSLKPKRGAGFRASSFFVLVFSSARARVRERFEGVRADLYRKKKFLSARVPDFASHKPECAKVRELFLPRAGARRPPCTLATGRRRRRWRCRRWLGDARERIGERVRRSRYPPSRWRRRAFEATVRQPRGRRRARRPRRAMRASVGKAFTPTAVELALAARANARGRCRNAVADAPGG